MIVKKLIPILLLFVFLVPLPAYAAGVWDSMFLTLNGTITVTNPSSPPAGGGGGSPGGGGGGGGATDTKRFTTVATSASADGVLWEDITAYSVDIKLELVIPEGTRVLNANGYPPSSITVTTVGDPGAPPADFLFLGAVYDVSPEGITFDPAATLHIYYDDDELGEGINERALCIYTWNDASQTWEPLDCTIDTERNRITATISHLCRFTIMIGSSPAEFSFGQLLVSPSRVESGKTVMVTTTVTNQGDTAGDYEAVFKVNDEVMKSIIVSLAGGEARAISFSMTAGVAGTYKVSMGPLQATFQVVAPVTQEPRPSAMVVTNLTASADEVAPGDIVIISATVTNPGEVAAEYVVVLDINGSEEASREVTLGGGSGDVIVFPVSRDVAGTYTVTCHGQECEFTVVTPPVETAVTGTIAGSDNKSASGLSDIFRNNDSYPVDTDSNKLVIIVIVSIFFVVLCFSLFMALRRKS